jgi:hypothetical protein
VPSPGRARSWTLELSQSSSGDHANHDTGEWIGGRLKLQIVWRNPQSRVTQEPHVEQIVEDAYGALYAVRRSDEIKVFELIVNRAA